MKVRAGPLSAVCIAIPMVYSYVRTCHLSRWSHRCLVSSCLLVYPLGFHVRFFIFRLSNCRRRIN